jgi:hypothetical protein
MRRLKLTVTGRQLSRRSSSTKGDVVIEYLHVRICSAGDGHQIQAPPQLERLRIASTTAIRFQHICLALCSGTMIGIDAADHVS